jgi:hypothetical protein
MRRTAAEAEAEAPGAINEHRRMAALEVKFPSLDLIQVQEHAQRERALFVDQRAAAKHSPICPLCKSIRASTDITLGGTMRTRRRGETGECRLSSVIADNPSLTVSIA